MMKLAQTTLLVSDYDEAIDYYVKILGFSLVEDTQLSKDKRWVVVSPSRSHEGKLLLAKASKPEQVAAIGKQAGGRVFLFLNTDDFWNDYNRLVVNGVTIVREPVEEAYGTVAVFADLYGNKWDLIGK